MNNRKLRKAIMTLCAALLLVSLSVGITVAYLTDTKAVVNTFTVGQVKIELDEADVDKEGVVDAQGRVKANEYHLMPGHEYIKDPIVHVAKESEDCFVYIRVDNNGIEAIEAKSGDEMANGKKYQTVSEQILANDWTWVTMDGNVHYFYKTVLKADTDKELEVFQNFMVNGTVDNTTLLNYYNSVTNKAVTVNAYAVQKDGFADFKAAWNATFAADEGNVAFD